LKLIQLKQVDLKKLKKIMFDLNNGICPLLGIKIMFDNMVVDHQHKLKSEMASDDGKGLVRNAIEFRANALEGKITNNWKRYYGNDETKHPCSLPEYLRRLADYLEKGPFSLNGELFIHPKEAKVIPKLKKISYNYLKKMYKLSKNKKHNKKFPDYPKSKKLTKALKNIYFELFINPEYYK